MSAGLTGSALIRFTMNVGQRSNRSGPQTVNPVAALRGARYRVKL